MAWASGAEIESRNKPDYELYGTDWILDLSPFWDENELEFRIKPQPKEPQYLYVYGNLDWDKHSYKLCRRKGLFGDYIGKIKLEQDDD